ncbi:hypothetical protein MAR_013462 [Mya arenaria]|uniref:NAD(P)-binding domain-containing protein n=1 Tax=Mya arenaria TaxID=6604 RepID=A0ABY7G3N6_MYAAR|nr:hypothetical protein MAR_013462 [Mya arenaria]
MRLAVLGATGRTGILVVREALARGHEVTAVVRNPDKLTDKHDNLQHAEGHFLHRLDPANGGRHERDNSADPFIVNWVLKPLLLGQSLHNKAEMEDFLETDCLDIRYTLVRPPQLTDSEPTENITTIKLPNATFCLSVFRATKLPATESLQQRR